MIKTIFKEGKPKDSKTEKIVNEHLRALDNSELEYIVGIDYASLHSRDYTVISRFVENEDGSLTHAGLEFI